MLGPLLDCMRHRGPDGDGVHHDGPVHMGMRRLAVIDLAHGWQPLTSRDGSVVVFQNGEIYNHRSLRSELEAHGWVFRTQSDTEVLAHGYAQWSLDGLLARVDGMFAIAIHDRERNELHLARDRLGEKPLFYSRGADGRFGYASTLLAAAALPWVSDTIDPIALDRYLALHFVPGERTMLADVRQLLPGEYLTLDIASFKLLRKSYYQLPLSSPHPISVDSLTDVLEEAVASRLIADVPVGVFLSGGLDSSLVAALAARRNGRIATFSIGFRDRSVDESDHAMAVAKHIGSEHHAFIFDQNDFARLLPEVAKTLDTPIGDQALLPVYWLSKEARRYVTVVLSGEGADEVFAGYSYYRPFLDGRSRFRLWSRPKSDLLLDASASTPSGFPLLTSRAERRALVGSAADAPDDWEQRTFKAMSRTRDKLQHATAAEMATWLPSDLLVKLDRMTMAHSLEGRAPYLAPAVVAAGLNLPTARRMTATDSKVALRAAAKRFLPDAILSRPKQGFVLPMRHWLGEWFAAHRGPSDYFASRPFPRLDMDKLCAVVGTDLKAGIGRERLLFALLLLMEWWHHFAAQRKTLRLAIASAHPSVAAVASDHQLAT
jgi:asparagine synthase (glutamine-hydrolysing)